MEFKIQVAPAFTKNALLNKAYKDAAYMQDPLEHALAKANGTESTLERYYVDDNYPRKNFSPSSSWIRGVDYNPMLRTATIFLGNTPYYYSKTPDQVGDLLTDEDGIGEHYNLYWKLKRK